METPSSQQKMFSLIKSFHKKPLCHENTMPENFQQKFIALKKTLVIVPLPREIKFLSKNPLVREFLPEMFNLAKKPPPRNKKFSCK